MWLNGRAITTREPWSRTASWRDQFGVDFARRVRIRRRHAEGLDKREVFGPDDAVDVG